VRLLNFLTDVRPPGWIPAGCAILDISGQTRDELHEQVAAARRRAHARGLVQRGTLVFADATRPFLLAWLVAPDEARPLLQTLLREFVEERVKQHGAQPVAGFGLLASSPRPLDALIVLEPARWSES
jgi:hypothetical protein